MNAADVEAASRLESLLAQAEASKRNGRHREGAAQAREAAELALQLNDLRKQTLALRLFGTHLFRLGELEDGARAGQRAVALLESLGDDAGLSDALCTLAMCYIELGLHDEALKAVTASLDAAHNAGDRKLLCWAYNRFGVAHDSMGNHLQAQQFLREALKLARELLEPEALFSALNNLSENAIGLVRQNLVQNKRPAVEEALRRGLAHVEEGLELARASGNSHREAICLGNFGMLRGLAGEYEAAIDLLRQSTDIARACGYRPLELVAAQYAAELLRFRGDLNGAIAKFQELLRAAPEQADKVLILRVHFELSRAYKEAGDFREALREHERYHQLERAINTSVAETRARMLMNRLELDNAKLETERARLEMELHRLRSVQLEAEKSVLEARTLELDRRANEDPLTGLWNRRHMEALLPRLFADSQLAGKPLSIAIGDIDHFKQINDRYGHLTGDQVLQNVASTIKGACEAADTVARLGGEEFVVLMVDTALQEAVEICERLRALIEAHNWKALHSDLRVTISFGVSDDAQAGTPTQLMAQADACLYEAKRRGRNCVQSQK